MRRVRGSARVVARVRGRGVRHGHRAVRVLPAHLRADRHVVAARVVVDHAVVVVPEHVLWRLRALRNRWYRVSEETEQCGSVCLYLVVRLPIALKDKQIASRCGNSGFLFTTVKQLYFKGQDLY